MGLRTVGLLGGAGPGRREGAAGWPYPESSAALATCLQSAHTQSGSWCHPACLKRRMAQGTWPATWQYPLSAASPCPKSKVQKAVTLDCAQQEHPLRSRRALWDLSGTEHLSAGQRVSQEWLADRCCSRHRWHAARLPAIALLTDLSTQCLLSNCFKPALEQSLPAYRTIWCAFRLT